MELLYGLPYAVTLTPSNAKSPATNLLSISVDWYTCSFFFFYFFF